MPRKSSIVLTLMPLALVNAQSKDGNAQCDCYNVNGAYFTNHRFWDFRFMAQSASDFKSAPALVTDSSNAGSTQSILQTDSFTSDWGIQDWGRGVSEDSPIALYNSPQNVYITQTTSSDLGDSNPSASTYLTLRTTRNQGFQSTAELENTQHNLMYASVRWRARVRGSAGACAGMFTVYNDRNEADIEILTRDPKSTIRYTNQPSVRKGEDVPGASLQKNGLPAWDSWRTHRLDWLPGITRSYIDGQLVAENKVNVPTKASYIDINMWSDGGVWTGTMTPGNSAELQIQWIETTFNTTGKAKRQDYPPNLMKRASQCSTVCTVDGIQNVGQPEVLSKSPSSDSPASSSIPASSSAQPAASSSLPPASSRAPSASVSASALASARPSSSASSRSMILNPFAPRSLVSSGTFPASLRSMTTMSTSVQSSTPRPFLLQPVSRKASSLSSYSSFNSSSSRPATSTRQLVLGRG